MALRSRARRGAWAVGPILLWAGAVASAGCITIDWDAYQLPPPPVVTECGDGQLDDGEVCDDGNTTGGDGCSADCGKIEVCGDGVVDAGEGCDDGGNEPGDGCTEDCKLESCGDDVPNEGEACDDGNTVPGDGCRADCMGTEQCGDGLHDPLLETPTKLTISYLATNGTIGEAPTIAFTLNGTTVMSPPVRGGGSCQVNPMNDPAVFGDENDQGPQSFEITDTAMIEGLMPTGNTIAIDTGTTGTVAMAWAKLVIESDNYAQTVVLEDVPPLGSALSDDPQWCSGFTVDRVNRTVEFDLETGEECDDGNNVDGDGCTADCIVERCGDGVVQDALGETCDDGNASPYDDCPADCRPLRIALSDATAFLMDGEDVWVRLFPDNNDGLVIIYDLEFFDASDQSVGVANNLNPVDRRAAFGNQTMQQLLTSGLVAGQPNITTATKVTITPRDADQRTGTPLTVPLGTQTCGNGVVEGHEECDDDNTDPLDGCTSVCLLPLMDLRTVVASRLNGDLIVLLDGFVTEPGLDHVDASFFNAADEEIASLNLAFEVDPSETVGPFLKRVTEQDLFTNNALLDDAVRVELSYRDALGQGSAVLSTDIVSTTCGDSVITPLIEDCDGGTECDDHCREINPSGCSPSNVYFCSVGGQRRGPGWFWFALLAGLSWRRRRREVKR